MLRIEDQRVPPNPAHYLRDGLSPEDLRRLAHARSDTDAARDMQRAKANLFQQLRCTV